MNEERQPLHKKWWFWLIIVIVVLWVIFGGGEETDEEEAENENETIEQDEQTENDEINVEQGRDDAEEQPETMEEEKTPAEDSEVDTNITPNMNEIMNKSEEEVNEALGDPASREEKEFRLTDTETRVPAVTSIYQDGALEIMFIEGTAQRITYTAPESIAYEKAAINELLNELGLESGIVSQNDTVTNADAEGIHEVSVYNNEGNINYVYIIVDEKYQ